MFSKAVSKSRRLSEWIALILFMRGIGGWEELEIRRIQLYPEYDSCCNCGTSKRTEPNVNVINCTMHI